MRNAIEHAHGRADDICAYVFEEFDSDFGGEVAGELAGAAEAAILAVYWETMATAREKEGAYAKEFNGWQSVLMLALRLRKLRVGETPRNDLRAMAKMIDSLQAEIGHAEEREPS